MKYKWVVEDILPKEIEVEKFKSIICYKIASIIIHYEKENRTLYQNS